ncbi:MAG: VWA domain-containing protein [Vicinamibacterales bacterium]
MKNVIRASCLGVCLAAAAVQAQQPAPAPQPSGVQPAPPTFRVEINYVEVDATVTDAAGNPVTDLTAADFDVLEDGKPQTISSFALVSIPVERAERPLFAAAPIEQDVQSNERANGRVYLIVLDDLHVHPLRSQRVKLAVRRFIERHFGVNDLAAIVYTSGRSDAGQEFTNNRRLLQASVDRFMGRKMRSSTLDRLQQYRSTEGIRGPGQRIDDPNIAERGFHARNALDSVKNLAEYLSGVRGRRKAMLFISEGIDYDIHDVFNNRDASTIIDSSREAIGAATRANVSIYAIDPRGLTSMGDEGIEIDSFPDDPTTGITSTSMLDELRLSQDSLRTLAEETGGFAAVNRNDFDGAFERVVRDNSTYYLLGYYPANDRRDGRFRRIDVRVTRPGLQVRSRRGYVAPRGRAPDTRTTDTPNASAAMRDAMNSPLPMAGVGMSVFAAPYKGVAPNAMVAIAVELAAGRFTYEEKDGAFANDLEVGFTAIDDKGKVHPGERNTINLALKPDTLARVKARGFRVISSMDLPPGRYQLRVAAAEQGGKSGSVLYDLEVPDFYKAPLTMSGLAITAASAGQTPTARSKDPLRDFLPAPPIATREFERTDELALFAEVYQNAPGAPPHKLDITTTVRSDEGRVVVQNQEERSSTELKGGRGGYGFATRIPLADFAPGTYIIHVEAKSRLAPDTGVGRDVEIRVR